MAAESTSFRYTDSFVVAASRKKRKNRPQYELPSTFVLLERTKQELFSEDWLFQCQQILRNCLIDLSFNTPDVLCLGLGSPSSSRDARAQLAYLLRICTDFDINPSKVSVYDPVFSEDDLALFKQLQVRPLTENKHARHLIEAPTILFMPHCDMHLYENILRENWTRDRLLNMLFVANRFAEYADSRPSRKLASEFPCLSRLVPYLDARPLPICNKFPTAFNNTSIQLVCLDADDPDAATFWKLPATDSNEIL